MTNGIIVNKVTTNALSPMAISDMERGSSRKRLDRTRGHVTA